MKTFQYALSTQPDRVRDRYDVVVAGAGTGGVAAALQASRLGASVLLVESTDWIGGQMTAAGVSSIDEGNPPRARVRERGIYGEYTMRARAWYRARGKSVDTSLVGEDHFSTEPQVGHRLLYDMIQDTRGAITPTGKPAVLDVLLRSEITRVEREGKTVTGVTLVIHSGPQGLTKQVACRVLIDATEYGDVIPQTGAAYRVGSWRSDGPRDVKSPPPVQPITWTAVVGEYPKGVPPELFLTQPPPDFKGGRPLPKSWGWDRFVKYRGMPDSTSPINARNGSPFLVTRTHLNFADRPDVQSGSDEPFGNDQDCDVLGVEGPRREEVEYKAILRTLGVLYDLQHVMGKTNWAVLNDTGYDSPFQRAQMAALIRKHPELAPFAPVLAHFPVMPYVRESRRIQGVYTLKARDIRRKAPDHPVHFPTAVALGDYTVDIHGATEGEGLVETDLDLDEDLPRKWLQWGYGPFQVPLESFIPLEIDGFLAAEKNLSQSRIVNGATRLQPSTMLTGQAAGAIAGVAVTMNVQPRAVPALAVQSALLDAGSTLSLTYYTDLPHGTELWKCVQLATVWGILDYPEPEFQPGKKATAAEIKMARERLAKLKVSGTQPALPASFVSGKREALARAIANALFRDPL